MGRKRVKKTCTSCGFNHNESEKACEVEKTVEQESSKNQEEMNGAVGGDSPPEVTAGNYQIRMPDQSALNELASLENRMNSRMYSCNCYTCLLAYDKVPNFNPNLPYCPFV